MELETNGARLEALAHVGRELRITRIDAVERDVSPLARRGVLDEPQAVAVVAVARVDRDRDRAVESRLVELAAERLGRHLQAAAGVDAEVDVRIDSLPVGRMSFDQRRDVGDPLLVPVPVLVVHRVVLPAAARVGRSNVRNTAALIAASRRGNDTRDDFRRRSPRHTHRARHRRSRAVPRRGARTH